MLPSNTTSKLQMLDVGINKPFKDYLQGQGYKFNINGFKELQEEKLQNASKSGSTLQDVTNTVATKKRKEVGLHVQLDS